MDPVSESMLVDFFTVIPQTASLRFRLPARTWCLSHSAIGRESAMKTARPATPNTRVRTRLPEGMLR